MYRLLLNNAFIPTTSPEIILCSKSWWLGNPKSDPNTVIRLQIHMGSYFKPSVGFDQQVLYRQKHLFDPYLNFLYIVIAASVGWCCSNPDSPFAGMRLMWFRTWQTNRGNGVFFWSFYCAHGKHTVAGRIFSVTSSSFSFLLLKITCKITPKGRRVLVLGIPSIWLVTRANHAKGLKGGTAKLPQEYHCPWYRCSSHARKEQMVIYMGISRGVEWVRPPL